ncbi:cation efflux family-domain-containing protein [Kockovaella imperatae]|uniref:Cation efflux family-domain-containing protein n=1 Tax=Kockovaella imperatae TaxID=4999 RepID=A0A1Y1UUK0_9TREE|nr:cation efflux family-domain-containing protein [Kockovaella imperatae]ORX41146.1 cation efflux family-domain-containing protein [Kockovaella imperatae]
MPKRRHASGQPGSSSSAGPTPSSSSKPAASKSGREVELSHAHEHDDHDGHDHHHHHGIFSAHHHDHHEGAEQIMQALESGKIDRGTKITLLGLGTNVGLTITKGLAGLWMNSAALVAEAGHSLSDLLGDIVTLTTWRISRRKPTDKYPLGFSKFETLGTLTVSFILVGSAAGIGLHSYHLLTQTLIPFLESYPSDSILSTLGRILPHGVPSPLLEMFHSHGPSADGHDHSHGLLGHSHDHSHSLGDHAHSHEAVLNPHAAWFAVGSIAVKEWLYRLTAKVAREEHSPVLKANALHHRVDAMTSLIALVSILGSSLGGYSFLDPIGGIAVSLFILRQGFGLTKQALFELLDRGVDEKTRVAMKKIVNEFVDGKRVLEIKNVRGVKSGGQTLVDLTITVPPTMTVVDSHLIEHQVRDALLRARKEVKEVRIHVHVDEDPADGKKETDKGTEAVGVSDFGRDAHW